MDLETFRKVGRNCRKFLGGRCGQFRTSMTSLNTQRLGTAYIAYSLDSTSNIMTAYNVATEEESKPLTHLHSFSHIDCVEEEPESLKFMLLVKMARQMVQDGSCSVM